MEALIRLTLQSAPEHQPPRGEDQPAEPELPEWARKLERIPQIDPVAVLGFGPTGAYLALNAIGGVRAAIAGAVVVGVIVWIVQRRLRPDIRVVRWLGMLSAALMIAFGVAGLIEEDGTLFWTSDAVDNFVIGGLFLFSALIGRPIVGPVLRELFPVIAERLPAQHRVWMKVTIVWGLKIVLSGLLRLWLLDQVDASTYAWIRLPIGWPINIVLFAWTFYVVDRAMQDAAIARGRERPGADSGSGSGPNSSDAGEVVGDAEVVER